MNNKKLYFTIGTILLLIVVILWQSVKIDRQEALIDEYDEYQRRVNRLIDMVETKNEDFFLDSLVESKEFYDFCLSEYKIDSIRRGM